MLHVCAHNEIQDYIHPFPDILLSMNNRIAEKQLTD